MAGRINTETRDALISAFRERVCETLGVAPYLHQREVWAASDGLVVLDEEVEEGGVTVQLAGPDGGLGPIVQRATALRPGGRARFLTDLGAFKIGKSYGVALWATGFAVVPGARVSLVGLEYDICEPEFSYLCEFLLSERGMGLKYASLQNRPRDGKMWLDFPNGARYEARSWERKDSLKGKEIDAYIYCEAYQLPGIECFTSFSQNLRARRGYAYFPTTPDRPWVKSLHNLGYNHGGVDADPEWHCTCDIPADVNPLTFDATAKRRDEGLMTREKFEIHYNGKLGDFVGHVFNYTAGQSLFTAQTHPDLFREGVADWEHLRIPLNWELVCGADTGTFYSALLVAFSETGDAFVLQEFPNYRYVAHEPERDEQVTIPSWARRVLPAMERFRGRGLAWADANSQFRGELQAYGIHLLKSKIPVEARTEVTREYFEHGRIFLAPWLSILPFELENAAWPEEATAAGKFARVKDRDHTLDCLEHVLARRPIGRAPAGTQKYGSWAASMGLKRKRHSGNVHLGTQ